MAWFYACLQSTPSPFFPWFRDGRNYRYIGAGRRLPFLRILPISKIRIDACCLESVGLWTAVIYFYKGHVQNFDFRSSFSTTLIRFVLVAHDYTYFSESKISSESVRYKLNRDNSKFGHFIVNKKCLI